MTGWYWNRATGPGELARYVQQDLTRKLLPAEQSKRLPGPGNRAPADKARLIFDVFAATGVRYVGEPSTSKAGLQIVRPVDQVLARPRHATCLDVCVAYAGACLDAGLHPMIVILDSPSGASSHAIVLVWLDGDWSASANAGYPFGGEVHLTVPVTEDGFTLPGEVRASVDADGSFLAIDVTGATWPLGGAASAKEWAAAVADGAAMIAATDQTSGALRWAVGIDVGLHRHSTRALDVPDWRMPTFHPLSAPYDELDFDAGPLAHIKARKGIVPFYARDELDLLLDWAEASSPTADGVELAVLHGVGGAGKTHLAAELCHRLEKAGWYTGFLAKHPVPSGEDLAWLAGVESPTLIVIDYVEDTSADTVIAVVKSLRGRAELTRVLVTARAVGDWLASITGGAGRDGVGVAAPLTVALPRRHPAATGVFRRAAQRFAELPGMSETDVEQPPPNPRWTTLDLVLQAWLAAEGVSRGALPTRRDALYDNVLHREFKYWRRTCVKRGLPDYPTPLFAQAGAVLTLLAPTTTGRATRALTAVAELAQPTLERATLIDVLTALLTPDADDEGFAIRPDPVGEWLVQREFTNMPELLDRCVPPNPSEQEHRGLHPDEPHTQANVLAALLEGFRACIVITRAAEQDPQAATRLARHLLHRHIHLWRAGYAVALNQGGPFATTLTELAERSDSPLPLAQLANKLPTGHAALRSLGLIATERSRPSPDSAATDSDYRASMAAWWNSLAVRRSDLGDRVGGLAAIDEAVALYRQLVEADSAALPDLAGALNIQAAQRGGVGDRSGALAAIDEAVGHYRQLAEADSAAFVPDLAAALNNQAVIRGAVGDRVGGLAAIDEAVALRRQLVEADSTALPDLAGALNNQAKQRSEVGDRVGGLAAIDEAVTHYRQLAEANPAIFQADLAGALSNQAAQRGGVGDRSGALAAIDEAVGHYRQLAEADSAAFVPDLAAALNNQAASRGGVGDRLGALAAIDDAVALCRQLVEADSAAFLPDLAGALNNQAAMRGEIGDRSGALVAIDEAVVLRRQLVNADSAAFLPGLALTLNNQAKQRSAGGDRGGALAAIDEAVAHYRQLVEADSAAFVSDLAMALSNQAAMRGEIGDRSGALVAIDEAVVLRRQLVKANAAAFLPDLAGTLNNQAAIRGAVGDRVGGLAAINEAVAQCRRLVEADPAAFVPDLAMALNNQAKQRSESGDRVGGLAAIDEAVALRRRLVEADSAAFAPALAMALNNQAAMRGAVGDRVGGLGAIDEAVALYRQLVETDPAAFLPDLAASLNNQANRRGAVGDRVGGLAAIDEAVTHYRQLAGVNSTAFLPSLVASLNNQASQRGAVGDRVGGLAAIDEAVAHCRQLAEADPVAVVPDLALALNNQAELRGAVGDRVGGLAAIDEAVTHYRQLAEAIPASFLPDLAMALNNQADLHSDVNDQTSALAAMDETLQRFTPGPRSELLVVRVRWRLRAAQAGAVDLEGVFDDLELAAATAAESDLVERSGAARRAIRAMMAELVNTLPSIADVLRSRLPAWVHTDIPTPALTLLDRWLADRGWGVRESIVRDNIATLLSDAGLAALTLAQFLYPEAYDLDDLHNLLDTIRTKGLDLTLTAQRAAQEHTADLSTWLAAPTWEESRSLLKQHLHLISAPSTYAVLEASGQHPVVSQHLGILRLIQRATLGSLDDVYDAVIDPVIAADHAMTCLEQLDIDSLDILINAVPNLLQQVFVGPYLKAVRAVIAPGTSSANDTLAADPHMAIKLVAQTGTATQRAAGANRLRRIARREPSVATAFEDLAAQLDPATAASAD